MDMKIERISENIIKVTISLKDLKERNIDFHSLTHNSIAAQELLWDMMDIAEIQYGFNFSNAHIVFEPIKDFKEGFTITITQLNDDTELHHLQNYIKNKFVKNIPHENRKARKIIYPIRLVYWFKNFDDICDAANKIHYMYSGDSTLFKLKEKYYLVLKSTKPGNYTRLEILLNEYGNKVKNSNFYEGYLNEYGEILINKFAIDTIMAYFN
jgi:adapter protein MecA 1/2